MVTTLVESSLHIPEQNIGFARLKLPNSFAIAGVNISSPAKVEGVRSMSVTRQYLPEDPTEINPIVTSRIDVLSIEYQNLKSMIELLNIKDEDALWSYAASFFDYDQEKSKMGIIQVFFRVFEEAKIKIYSVLLLSQLLDDVIYSSNIFELIENTTGPTQITSELKRIASLYFRTDQDDKLEILTQTDLPVPEGKVELILMLTGISLDQGRKTYWQMYNLLVLKEFTEIILGEEKKERTQTFDDGQVYNVTLEPLATEVKKKSEIRKNSFRSRIYDKEGQIGAVIGNVITRYPVITDEERNEAEFGEDEIYHDEPDEIMYKVGAELLHRRTGLNFYLEIKAYEYDEDSDEAILRVSNGDTELQKIRLNIIEGLMFIDEPVADLARILEEKEVDFYGILTRVVQLLDRTLGLLSTMEKDDE